MSSIKGCLPLKVIFHQILSSIKGCLPLKIVFHQRLPFIQGHLPSKAIFHQRSSSIKDCLPSKVVFHKMLSSIKGCLPSKSSSIKIFFYQRLSSIKSRLPPKVILHCTPDGVHRAKLLAISYFLQSCKKTFFVRYLYFQLKNVWILYLLNFAIIWPMKLNKCSFSSQFSSFGVELFKKSTVLEPFYAKNAKFSCNYLKMSRFSSRNVRYPRYQDTAFSQLCNWFNKSLDIFKHPKNQFV